MAVFPFSCFLSLTVLEHLEQRERRDVDLLGRVHLRDVASRPGGGAAAAGLAQQALEAVHDSTFRVLLFFFFRSDEVE